MENPAGNIDEHGLDLTDVRPVRAVAAQLEHKVDKMVSQQTHVLSLLSQPCIWFWFSFLHRLGIRTPEAKHSSVVYNTAHLVKL